MGTITEELKKLSEKYNISMDEIKWKLERESQDENDRKIREKVSENSDLIGKCFVYKTKPRNGMFPEMKKYFKVISNQSENQYRVECLFFYEYPVYWFKHQMHKAHFAGDFFLGSFEFKSFYTDSVMADAVRKMTEISSEEFADAMMKYTERLSKMEWTANHYRMGGCLPSDERWKKKE